MYDKLTTEWKENFKPVTELLDINSVAIDKLIQQNVAYTSAVLRAGVDHAKALTTADDANAAIELQKGYLNAIGEKFVSTAKQNVEVLVEAKDAAAKIIEGSVQAMQDKVAAKKPAATKKAA